MDNLTPEREAKFRHVISRRQPDLTVILENVHDVGNIAAVMRSCDAVGIGELFVLVTNPEIAGSSIKLGRRSSAGTRRWVDVHYYQDVDQCFQHVKEKCSQIFHTEINEQSKSLYDLDLTQPTALVFGNEHEGVSKEVAQHSDGVFSIPQVGMVDSLNISVACAVSVFEAFRQRKSKGFYDGGPRLSEQEQGRLLEEFNRRHMHKEKRAKVKLSQTVE